MVVEEEEVLHEGRIAAVVDMAAGIVAAGIAVADIVVADIAAVGIGAAVGIADVVGTEVHSGREWVGHVRNFEEEGLDTFDLEDDLDTFGFEDTLDAFGLEDTLDTFDLEEDRHS